MLMNYLFTLDSVFKLVPPKAQNQKCLNKPVCFTHTMVLLNCVNETMYLLGNLHFFKILVSCFMAQDDSTCANVISMHVVGERPGATLLGLRYFLSLTSRQYLLKTSRGWGTLSAAF